MRLNCNNLTEDSNCKNSFTDPFDFCTMEEIENNKRFQLLQLRNQDVSQFKNLTMIPCDEKDLDEDMLQVSFIYDFLLLLLNLFIIEKNAQNLPNYRILFLCLFFVNTDAIYWQVIKHFCSQSILDS